MITRKKIRVLIVDDSAVFREIIARGISSDPNIEVVAKAIDAFDARDKIIEYEPDVITCDVEMPKMNGMEFVKRLMPQYPLPIIVVSSLNNIVFDVIDAGAVDFVGKPDVQSVNSVENFITQLINKIKIASVSNIGKKHVDTKITSVSNNNTTANTTTNNITSSNTRNFKKNPLIALGASTGGTEAIFNILKDLPSNTPGIVIVQHIPPVFSKMFADRLNNTTGLNVKEAETGDYVEIGKVLIAPGDKHMTVKRVGDKYRVECLDGAKVNGHCPSVDVLFDSVAKCAGNDAIGIILTGMGYDGAKGLLAMKRKGAKTIGQNNDTCVVYGMPKVAYDIGAIERQLPLFSIANYLCSLLI